MSRIGEKPIPVPDAVKVAVRGRTVTVEGPKGKLSWTHREEVAVSFDPGTKVVTVTRKDDDRLSRALHGTTRALIANMIEGCLNGYTKQLEVYGIGYGVQVQVVITFIRAKASITWVCFSAKPASMPKICQFSTSMPAGFKVVRTRARPPPSSSPVKKCNPASPRLS